MIHVLIILVSVFLSGCASSTKQTDSLFTQSALPFKNSASIENVPFINQSENQCGPATLTMAMNWAGKPVSVTEVTEMVYTPGMKGSLQTDMISAARRNGFLVIAISGMNELLTEINSGHPVIVFENLALSWFPKWHYAIVTGYDLKNETVRIHSGPEENKIWDIRKFERSWKLADYWGLVVLPTTQLSATRSELDHVKAAVALEQVSLPEASAAAYLSILSRWPNSFGALIGLGGWEYKKGNYKKSVEYLRAAVREYPDSKSAKHNLAIALAAELESSRKKAPAKRK